MARRKKVVTTRYNSTDRLLQFVSVPDITAPDLSTYTGPGFLIAYDPDAEENFFTLYAWDSSVSSGVDSPWCCTGSSGYWVAVGGRYIQGIHNVGTSSGNSKFEADGTLVFENDAIVYNDLQFSVSQGKIPTSNNPTWAALTTNTGEWGFGVDEYIDLESNELPHSWAEGTVGDFHLHLSVPNANSSGSSQYIKATCYIAYVNASGVWTETSLTAEKEIPTGTVALQNFYLDLGDVSFAGLTIGTQVKCRIKRIAATTGTEYPSDAFFHQVGTHLENDTVGSRTETAK